jgi:undecaprenyl-diphosphatase
LFSEIRQIDLIVQTWIDTIQYSSLTQFFEWISVIADPLPMLLLSAVLIVALVVQRDWKETLVADIALLGGLGIHYLLKILIGRIRPEGAELIETTPSFPSGHSTMSVIFFALLIFYVLPDLKNKALRKGLQFLSIILMILIPFSRIYLGLHWFSDVLAGIILGAVVFVLSMILAKKYIRRS